MIEKLIIFLEFLSIIITMFSMALIADKYLIPTLTFIAKKYSLSEQVEGILLAIGASIPEFTTNLIASFTDSVDIGIGAIAGSGSYDFTICFGFASLFTAGMTLHGMLYYRDSVVYLLTLGLLTYFLLDQKIQLYEAAILTCLWPFYIFLSMYKIKDESENTQLQAVEEIKDKDDNSSINNSKKTPSCHDNISNDNNKESQQLDKDNDIGMVVLNINQHNISKTDSPKDEEYNVSPPDIKEREDEHFTLISSSNVSEHKNESNEEREHEQSSTGIVKYFEIFYEKSGYVYSFFVPLWDSSPISGFLIIMVIIFIHSNLIVLAIQNISDRLEISETFLGMTIISWGGNIGDTINACVAAKNNASALISTSILGSQITNLQLCLGFPWLLAMIKHKFQGRHDTTIVFGSISDKSQYNPLYYFIPLLMSVLMSMIIFGAFRMKLNKWSGGLLTLVYISYFTYESYIQSG